MNEVHCWKTWSSRITPGGGGNKFEREHSGNFAFLYRERIQGNLLCQPSSHSDTVYFQFWYTVQSPPSHIFKASKSFLVCHLQVIFLMVRLKLHRFLQHDWQKLRIDHALITVYLSLYFKHQSQILLVKSVIRKRAWERFIFSWGFVTMRYGRNSPYHIWRGSFATALPYRSNGPHHRRNGPLLPLSRFPHDRCLGWSVSFCPNLLGGCQ